MIRRVMLDIETLGTVPGAVFFAVGAVEFTGGVLGREFSVLIDPADAQKHGLKVDAETVGWWLRQSPEAQAEAARAWTYGDPLLPSLQRLRGWLEGIRVEAFDFEVWGNAPSLDCELVEAGYRAVDLECPWPFWQERCYRTLKNLRPDMALERTGTHHVALEDARSQARHAIALLEALGCGDWRPKIEARMALDARDWRKDLERHMQSVKIAVLVAQRPMVPPRGCERWRRRGGTAVVYVDPLDCASPYYGHDLVWMEDAGSGSWIRVHVARFFYEREEELA